MFLNCDGVTLHVRLDGPPAGEPVLLLHSLGTCGAVWDAQADRLQARYRVLRPDLRGHGLSALVEGDASIAGFARDMLAVLDGLGLDSVHVAGLSIGGLVAQAMAAQAPARVRSLVLCDTAMCIAPAQMWRDRAALVRAEGLAPIVEGVLARWLTPAGRGGMAEAALRAMLTRTPAEGYAAAAMAIAGADLTGEAGAIAVPTLILVGDGDQATPPALAEDMRRAIPGAVLTSIAEAAHIPTMERPVEVADAMVAFLDGLDAPAQTDRLQAGMQVRRAVLGEAHVARAVDATTPFDAAFQDFITRTAWGGVWARPHLDRRMRSLLTLCLLAGLGREEEFRLHVRASRNTGASPTDLAEALLHVAVYAGIPAANSAMRIAKQMFAEMGVA